MKLVGCPECHAQYDVADAAGATVTCRCGATFPATPPPAIDAAVTRCAACGALVGETEAVCGYCGAEVSRRPQPSGPVCPECYARNPEKARFCTSCGVAFSPQPLRAREGSLRCPACPSGELAPRSLGGLWAEECPACLGLWAPGDVMERLVAQIREKRQRDGFAASGLAPHERRTAWEAEVTYRHCPECGAMMQRRNFGKRSGVIVDSCLEHGTWLDADEMEDIASFVMGGGLERAEPAGVGTDPGHDASAKQVAAMAAVRILAEERARGAANARARAFTPFSGLKGIGDLISLLLR